MARQPKSVREREEALAAIVTQVTRRVQREGLLGALETAARRLFGLDQKEIHGALNERGPKGLLLSLPAITTRSAKRWRDGMRPHIEDVVSMQAGSEADDPFLQEWLDKMTLELSGSVPETTREKVERRVKEGIANEKSPSDIAESVGEVFEEAKGHRSSLIARTESTRARNAASWLKAKNSEVVTTKTWLATNDDRTRDEHRKLHGMTLPLDADFPGDEGKWPQAIQCRCALTFGVDD